MRRTTALWAIGLSAALLAPALGMAALAQPTEYKEVQHPQPGEVKYADKWVDVSDLFKQYEQAKQDFAALLDQKKATNDQLVAIQQTLAGIESDYQKAAAPIRQQQSDAAMKMAQAQQYLAMRPPVKPVDQPDPPYPNRAWYRDDGSYNAAVNNHQNYVNQVHRDNQTRQNNYTQQLAQFNANQQQAQKTLADAQTTINSCTQQLQQLDATRKAQEQDPLAQKKKLNDDQVAQNQQANTLVNLKVALYDAIMICPDTIRFERGIVNYRNSLYTADEIQALLDKAKADLAAMPGSTGRQDDVDELKALADRVKAATKGAAPAVTKT